MPGALHILANVSFEALYHADRLHLVNPEGDVGLVTLWSPFRTVERKLSAMAPALLDPARSRIAVVANLYGDGMQAMFCNLLYNPQVRHLVGVGEDLGLPTCDEIEAFLARGLEDYELLGTPVKRVRGTGRVFPSVPGFDDGRLREAVSFRYLGKLSRPELADELPAYVDALPREPNGLGERMRVEIPEPVGRERGYLPSEAGAHQVVRARPLDCWEELVVRTVRFGRPVSLAKGARLELLNAKAVITSPAPESAEALGAFGFSLGRFEEYGRRVLDGQLPEGISYTYGNRLRSHFGDDGLERVVGLLRADPETRGAYLTLWDNTVDLFPSDAGSKPCLATLFFRRSSDGLLTLTATYRSHNLLTAWLENVYGLMAIQRWVGERVGMAAGALTVVSHSLGVDPASPRYAMARSVADGWTRDDDLDRATGKYSLRADPNGYFVVTADRERGLVVAENRFGGVLVKRYEAARAVDIEREVSADMAVSLVSHAMWLGRELSAAERLLRG